MCIGFFLDKEHPPTPRAISQTLGAKQPRWKELTRLIADQYQIPGELSFGGKKYGWHLWYRKGGKTLVSLFPQRGYLVAQIVLGKAQAEQALPLKLGKNVRQVLEETPQLHDGRWLFIKVRTAKDVKDIEQLLHLKRRPRKPKVS